MNRGLVYSNGNGLPENDKISVKRLPVQNDGSSNVRVRLPECVPIAIRYPLDAPLTCSILFDGR